MDIEINREDEVLEKQSAATEEQQGAATAEPQSESAQADTAAEGAEPTVKDWAEALETAVRQRD